MDASDLDRRLGIVSCRHCGAIYDLTRKGARPTAEVPPFGGAEVAAEAPPKESLDRAPAPLPEGFQVERGREGLLRVRWRWFRPVAFFLVFFCVAWDGFLITWYSMGLASGDQMPLIFFLFPLAHVAVGVGLTYWTAALFLNRSTVTVTRDELRVSHGPLPWFPSPRISVGELEQLYVERKVSHRKNGTTVTFKVMAVTRSHTGRKLIGGLEELRQALYLEQEIEQVLGIRDRPVAGEHRDEGVQH
ncbi:MAG: hypothetical protein KDA24_17870 [Deltaproteobacteria bacterium]|nr:hypothetical protein [Deltaproteobacteria bacterium]